MPLPLFSEETITSQYTNGSYNMPKYIKLTTPEGNMKGLQRIMNNILSGSKEEQIENAGRYASLANAMTSAQREARDQEKFELEKTKWDQVAKEVEEIKAHLRGV